MNSDLDLRCDASDPAGLLAEIRRRDKIITALMNQVQRNLNSPDNDFALLQTTFVLEEQVKRRTEELGAAKRDVEAAGNRLAAAIGSISEGFALFDPEDRLLLCNEVYLKLLHLPPDSIGRTFEELLRDVSERHEMTDPALIELRLENHRTARGITEYRLIGGQHVQIRETKTADGCTVALYADITEMTDAQARLLRDAVDNMDQGIAMFDSHLRMVVWNRRFLELLGISENYVRNGLPLEALLRYSAERGEYGEGAGEAMVAERLARARQSQATRSERTRPNGIILEIIEQPLPHGGLVVTYTDITARKQAESVIWRQANHDLLTALPNRRRLHELLQQDIDKARQTGRSLAILLVDLDHFTEINDRLGHGVGDHLLFETAARLRFCVGGKMTVGHLGGDEFVVVLSGLEDLSGLDARVAELHRSLVRPYRVGIETIYLTASIGITVYPLDGSDIDELLKNVDMALIRAKKEGRNRSSRFSHSLREVTQTRLQLATDLRHALADGQLAVYFQPIIEMASRRIVKAEALLRWYHPERGLVSPAQFIPLAEESGLISEIGDWTFRQAATMVKRWCGLCPRHRDGDCLDGEMAGIPPCDWQIAVNKSPRQFYTGSTQHDWVQYLREQHIPPRCISIEITEGLLLDQHAEVIDKLWRFREAGIQIAIDDFGTGYSAMSYLKKFAIDCIKIDQSFVRDITSDPSDRAIAEAIIVMAHKLGMKVVAEGIETDEQYDLLAAAGCDFGQGYLFARPLPADQFVGLIVRDRASLPKEE